MFRILCWRRALHTTRTNSECQIKPAKRNLVAEIKPFRFIWHLLGGLFILTTHYTEKNAMYTCKCREKEEEELKEEGRF